MLISCPICCESIAATEHSGAATCCPRCGVEFMSAATSDAASASSECVATVTWQEDAPVTIPDLALPSEFPGYEILGFVARGGMGVVLKARQVALNRLVALKLPLPGRVADPQVRHRFLREARSAARLRHPHICPIHEVGEADGRPFIALDYIEGQTLRSWAMRQHPSARRVAEIVAQLARAVGYAHERGVVHRDLKPSNVLVEHETGQPILTDFGLAKEVADSSIDLTRFGQVMGTPAYMSPEQAAGRADEIGPLSDVYSLGVILYELLCGRPPFLGTVGEIIRSVQVEAAVPVRRRAPRVHRDLETICHKALAKSSGDRYASAVELADDLSRFASGEPIVARREGLARRSLRALRRRPVASAIVAAALLVAALGGYLFVSARTDRRVAVLVQEIDAGLRLQQWSAEHLDSMDQLIVRLQQLAPEEAAPARQRVLESYTAWIGRLINSPKTLSDDEAAAIRAQLALLQSRDAARAAALSAKLKDRLAHWELVIAKEVRPPFDNIHDVFASAVVSDDCQAITRTPRFAVSPPAVGDVFVLANVNSAAHVQVNVTFGPNWKRASHLGVMLDAQPGHSGPIYAVAFSPDGKLLATGGADRSVRLWDVATGKHVTDFAYDGDSGTRIQFSPNGRMIAVGSDRAPVRLFSLDDGREIATLERAASFAFAPQSDVIVSASGQSVAWYGAKSGKRLRAAPLGGFMRGVRFSPDGETLAVVDAQGVLSLWTSSSGQSKGKRQAHAAPIRSLAASPDFSMLATGGDDKTVKLWETATLRELATLGPFDAAVDWIGFSPDGRLLAAHAYDKSLVYDVSAAPFKAHLEIAGLIPRFHPNGATLAAPQWHRVELWDLRDGRRFHLLDEPLDHVRDVAFSPDGSMLAAAGDDRIVRFYKTESGQQYAYASAKSLCALVSTAENDLWYIGGVPLPDPPSIAEAVDGGMPIYVQLFRDGSRLRAEQIELLGELDGPLHLWFERTENRISFRVGDRPALVFEEVFPPVNDEPRIGLIWPEQTQLTGFRVSTRQLPAAPSPLETADVAYASGDFQSALETYRRYVGTAGAPVVAQEARYKSAVCLAALGRSGEAAALFDDVAHETTGERWPALAACQSWLLALRANDLGEAEKSFNYVSVRYPFESLAGLMPDSSRREILQTYARQITSVEGVLHFNRDRVRNARRIVAVEKYLGAENANTQLLLARALRLTDQRQAALDVIKTAVADGATVDLVLEYAWLLRLSGNAQLALESLNHALAEQPGAPGNDRLLAERARVHIVLDQWDLARDDVQRAIREFDANEGNASPAVAQAYLIGGFLHQRDGSDERALDSWRRGFQISARLLLDVPASPDRPTRTPAAILHFAILGSLSGAMRDEHVDWLIGQIERVATPGSAIGGLVRVFTVKPNYRQVMRDVVRSMWRGERGRVLARRIAYRQLSFVESVREPIALAATEFAVRSRIVFADDPSADEEVLLYELAKLLFTKTLLTGELEQAQLAQLYAALNSQALARLIGWKGLQEDLVDHPDLRSRLAYVFGVRYRRAGDESAARQFFQTAMEADPNSLAAKLAEEALNTAPSVR